MVMKIKEFQSIFSGMRAYHSICRWPYRQFYTYKLARFERQLNTLYQLVQERMHRQAKLRVNKDGIKKILIIKDEGLGDMLIITALIRNLAKAGYLVDVLATEFNHVIIDHNPYVHEIIWTHEAYKEKHYDLVMDVRFAVRLSTIERMTFCQDIPCDYLITFNRSHFACYDVSLDFYEEGKHVTALLGQFLDFLGVQGDDLFYDIFLDSRLKEQGARDVAALRSNGGPLVVVNPYASRSNRDMSQQQVRELTKALLARYPQAQIVCIGMPQQLKGLSVEGVQKYHSESVMQVMPLIAAADLVVTPDTSAVHIASAYQRPTLALYVPTLRNPHNAKEAEKRNFYLQKYLMENAFFDAPRIKAGIRPQRVLLIEDLFAPNNHQAQQFISPTMEVSGISALELIEAAFRKLQ